MSLAKDKGSVNENIDVSDIFILLTERKTSDIWYIARKINVSRSCDGVIRSVEVT